MPYSSPITHFAVFIFNNFQKTFIYLAVSDLSYSMVPRLSCPVAHRISVSRPGIELTSPALEVCVLNRWATREVPHFAFC